jgi:Osmosensitive K+ channel histidine kinase
VPNAYKEKIFDRFFEVAANNKPDNSYNIGTGIGLSIAKNIVQLHKGSIGIKDNRNTNGSVFYIKLPLGKAHLTEQEVIKDFKFSDDVSQYVTQLNTTTPIIEDSLEDSLEDNVKNN